MKKFLLLFISVLMIISALKVENVFATEKSKVKLIFAENCRQRDGCVFFEEQGNDLIKNNTLNKDQEILLDIVIKNPHKEKINSVSAWIKFDSTVLEAIRINTDSSPFNLASPDGNEINQKESLIQIGRAIAGNSIDEDNILVASVLFKVITDQKVATFLEFFNFQATELGQTGIFSINGVLVENLLSENPQKLKIFLNDAKSNVVEVKNDLPQKIISTKDNANFNAQIERPRNLRIRSEMGQVRLIWEKSNDPRINGYFVFYSTQSGIYFFRRDVGLSNMAVIDNLNDHQNYFFAITSYDSQMNETDFSDEVFATVSNPGSESHPMRGNIFAEGKNFIAPGAETESVGPENIIFFISIITTWIVIIFKPFISIFPTMR